MLRNIVRFMTLAVAMLVFSQAIFAQEEKEIRLDSSYGRGGTLVINRAGNYRLSDDVTVRSGDGIVINASNVSLNLNGNFVRTLSAGTGRGIFINGVSGVSVKNGKVGQFNSNVMISGAVNVVVEGLQIVGGGLAPNNGPTEIGVQIVNSRSVGIGHNNISSVNLGVFVRGGRSSGNRIFNNMIAGGGNPANNLLGICYNPAAGGGDAGPRGDNIYNNHVVRFGYAFAISSGTMHNVFNENVTSSFNGAFREPETLVENGGTNVSDGNLATIVPAEML